MIDLEHFRQRLLVEKERIGNLYGVAKSEGLDIGEGNQSLTDIYPDTGDVDEIPDHATDTYIQELDAALARKFRDKLRGIEGALQRIEVGTYGKCMKCGKEISAERLEAFPETPFCFNDAAEDEALE